MKDDNIPARLLLSVWGGYQRACPVRCGCRGGLLPCFPYVSPAVPFYFPAQELLDSVSHRVATSPATSSGDRKPLVMQV